MYFILSDWPLLSKYSALPELCLSLFVSLWCQIVTVVFNVYCGHIILLKFQPVVVRLSGFLFTCPVPSPTVTLRVKSTLLKEFTQTTKVCEQERYQITQTILLLMNAWIHVGWVCMCDVVFITPWRCHPAWMVHLSVSQQMHFIVITIFMCWCRSKTMKLTFVCLYHAFWANIHYLVILYVLYVILFYCHSSVWINEPAQQKYFYLNYNPNAVQ